MQINNDIEPLFYHNFLEFKYLSPCVFKNKEKFNLYFCNRGKNFSLFNKFKKITGSIYSRESKDLNSWEKETLILKPPRNSKFNSFVSPSVIDFYGSKLLFVEAQNRNKSYIRCFEIKKSKEIVEKNIPINDQENVKSPYAFKFKGNLFLFFSYKNSEIRCEVYDKNLRVIRNYGCFTSFHKKIIYSPAILEIKNSFFMFYADWENNHKGNISIAISNNLEHWKIIKKNIFLMNNKVKIVSEPFVLLKKKRVIIFFEFKRGSKWNLSKYSISLKRFLDFLSMSDKI